MVSGDPTALPRAGRGRVPLILAAAAFLAFLTNAVIGKASLLLNASTPVDMGSVPEFALLIFATGCFVVAILEKERARQDESERSVNHQKEERRP